VEETIHFMHVQTKAPVCGQADRSVPMDIDIEKINCVECLRSLLRDAARYGNGRTPRRGA
jgi:hypothetical protein